jgi:ornithine cyclodeaminase
MPSLPLAGGFSGHGLQHAPATGRALAEYIVFGEYRTIDSTPFSCSRYLRGRPFREHNVIQERRPMLHLDAGQVAARLGRAPLIDALMQAFRSDHEVPERLHYALGGPENPLGTLLVMPAWQMHGSLGVKLVTVFPGNGRLGLAAVHAAYALFDATNGLLRAVLDGTELTRRRTAAASALAARYLARADADRLLLVGTGGLATHLIESHAVVRPLRSVRVWGRHPERAAAVARALADRPYAVEAADDLEAAVGWADIISCATLSQAPLVRGAWLRPGQHLDLVGSFTPAMREADDEALARASIYVDTPGALAESGELVQAIASGAICATDIRGDLGELARGALPGRRSAEEITLFKSVGCALEDLAAADLAVRGAANIGGPATAGDTANIGGAAHG